MPTRFVILHHRIDGGEHWDLMLERTEALMTWQLLCEPVDRISLPIPARRIGNHRVAYLEYEGPVSRDRGSVVRVDAGAVKIEKITADCCVFDLSGSRLSGRFVLSQNEGDRWTLEGA